MPVSLLATKFYIPPARADIIARPRLTEKLLAGLQRPRCFVLLSGPAGSGKTTLLSQFVAQQSSPVAWLSLDEGDDDPARFWTYLIAACRTVHDDVGSGALALLAESSALPDETIPTLLINDLSEQESELVLILDDYHTIHNPAIHAGLAYLLQYLPANLHLVISTRVDPPWSLARYRVRQQLIEIRAVDLRFSHEEAAAFFNQVIGLDLPATDLAALEERTEGWAAGLQLAALALQSPPSQQEAGDAVASGRAFVRAFAGSHLYVAEYLVEEVLQRQAEDRQAFLLHTSILERLNGELCTAVTQKPDGQATLLALHRANLFVIPLDDEGRWFRYHHLFADLLQARLRRTVPQEAIAALHRRAAGWYEQHGHAPEAIKHALLAGDYEGAALLVDVAGQALIFSDQYTTLKTWLDALPEEAFVAHPRLEIYRVLLALTKGTLDMSEKTLCEKEALINALPASPENDRLRVEALVYLALFLAFQNTSRAIAIAEEALPAIPEEHLKRRAYLFSALYRAHGMAGDVDKAERAYVESLRLAQAAGHYGMAANTTMIRTFDLCQYGRLDEAYHYCQVIVDAGAQLQQKLFHPAGPAYIGLAGIHLERYELDLAEAYLEQGTELCRQGGMYGLFTAYVQKARLLQAQGTYEKAVEELRTMEQALQRREFTLMARHVSLCLAMGDRESASHFAAELLAVFDDTAFARKLPLIAVESYKLSLSRIYIAQGKLAAASQLLEEVETTVEPGKRFGRLLEVYLLRALLLQKENAGAVSATAVAHMERALELAEPPGFVLLLLEEGPALLPLLQAVVARRAAPASIQAYARRLLVAAGAEEAAPGAVPGLVESLTPREMEVLARIAAGDSNRDIADRLFITVRTVKKHAGNVYGKLNVSSRTQAVARARELGLLPGDD